MSFYSDWVNQSLTGNGTNEPIRKNSYIVEISANGFDDSDPETVIVTTEVTAWNAKSISLPRISLEAGATMINDVAFFGDGFTFKDKGLLKLDNVKMTLYNLPNQEGGKSTFAYFLNLMNPGSANMAPRQDDDDDELTDKDKLKKTSRGLLKYGNGLNIKKSTTIGEVNIKTINPVNNKILETYSLKNPRIIELNAGTLDYSSDDVSEIEIVLEFMSMLYYKGDKEDNGKDPLLTLFSENFEERKSSLGKAEFDNSRSEFSNRINGTGGGLLEARKLSRY